MRGRALKTLLVLGAAVSILLGTAATALAADSVAGVWYQASGPLQPAVTRAGTIESAGDADWYYFYNAAQGQVRVGFNSVAGASLRLYRWEGGYIQEVDSIGYSGLIDQVMVPGLYYVQVYDNYDAGAYDVTASGTFVQAAASAGVQSHPAVVSSAEDYSLGWTSAQGPMQPLRPHATSIYSAGDSDWYYFYNAAQGQVRIGFNSAEGASLRLYRWDGGYLREIDSLGYYGLIDQVMVPGLYYVKVYDNYDAGTYDLTTSGTFVQASTPAGVQAHPAVARVTENNIAGEPGAVGPLTPTTPYASSIEAAGDSDWYYFFNAAQGQVQVGFNSDEGASVTLYRSEGGYLQEVDYLYYYGLIDQVMVPGLYYVKVYDNYDAGAYDVTASGSSVSTIRPSQIALAAPSTVGYKRSTLVRGYLTDIFGAGRPGTVTIQRSYDNATWSDLTNQAADTTGYFAVAYNPSRTTYYRAIFGGDSQSGGAVSTAVPVTVKVSLTRPTAPKTARTSTTFASYGYLKPRHTSGSYPVKIKCYRYEKTYSGTYRWTLRKTVRAKAANYSSYTKYKASIRLPYKGKWRIRAYHAADAKNATTYSSYRYVTIK